MRRWVNELGFVGTLVTGTCAGLVLDDERFDPVLGDNVGRFLEQADLTDVEGNAIAHGNAEALMRI